jgi:hypothetical protein
MTDIIVCELFSSRVFSLFQIRCSVKFNGTVVSFSGKRPCWCDLAKLKIPVPIHKQKLWTESPGSHSGVKPRTKGRQTAQAG